MLDSMQTRSSSVVFNPCHKAIAALLVGALAYPAVADTVLNIEPDASGVLSITV